jgi:hypothetical protein
LSIENDSNFHKRVRFWLDSLGFFVEKDVVLLVIASHFDIETYDVIYQFTQLEIVLNEYKQHFELYDVLRFGIDPHIQKNHCMCMFKRFKKCFNTFWTPTNLFVGEQNILWDGCFFKKG